VRQGVTNFASNLNQPGYVLNDLLQLRVGDAVQNTLRFAINSTVGIGGLLDPATAVGLPAAETDFGETMHVYGLGEGDYHVLPVLGPSTTRDSVGRIVDFAMNPCATWLSRRKPDIWPGARVAGAVRRRSDFASTIDDVLYRSEDSYTALRSLYLQNRRFELRGGRATCSTRIRTRRRLRPGERCILTIRTRTRISTPTASDPRTAAGPRQTTGLARHDEIALIPRHPAGRSTTRGIVPAHHAVRHWGRGVRAYLFLPRSLSAQSPDAAAALVNARRGRRAGRHQLGPQAKAPCSGTSSVSSATYADVPIIAQSVVGPPWRSASGGDRRAFIAAFQGYMARKYGRRSGTSSAAEITVTGSRPVRNFVEVISTSAYPALRPFEVRWLVSDGSGQTKFFNMIIEGVNLMITERSRNRRMLDARGGDLGVWPPTCAPSAGLTGPGPSSWQENSGGGRRPGAAPPKPCATSVLAEDAAQNLHQQAFDRIGIAGRRPAGHPAGTR
jgi:ABC-type transporter lipoprotein component MlaA